MTYRNILDSLGYPIAIIIGISNLFEIKVIPLLIDDNNVAFYRWRNFYNRLNNLRDYPLQTQKIEYFLSPVINR